MSINLVPARREKLPQRLWIYLWVILCVLPVLPYAQPLWLSAFADTPYAYLLWIPVFGFLWAGWFLHRVQPYHEDGELSGILGVSVLLFAGGLYVAGMTRWQFVFQAHNEGLLIWPLWALGMAWVMFGIGVTRYIWRPLIYLWLCWPPLYATIVAYTNPLLEGVADRLLTTLTPHLPWVHPSSPVGTFVVFYHQTSIPVYVSSVCSGSDSLLAIVTLFPIVLVSFEGRWGKKLLTLFAGVALTLIGNWFRLIVIIVSLHFTGPAFALGILHPVLGLIIFGLILLLLVGIARFLGLQNRNLQATSHLLTSRWCRLTLAAVGASVLTILLIPMYTQESGNFGKPVLVATSRLQDLMPTFSGFNRTLVGTYDEESVLGPGSTTTAMRYTGLFGNDELVELWWTPQPISIEGYGEQQCLLFHGITILSQRSLSLAHSLTGTTYTLLLPPSTLGGSRPLWQDTVFTYAVHHGNKDAYVRAEIAHPILAAVPSTGNFANAANIAVDQVMSLPGRVTAAYAPLSEDQSITLHNYAEFVQLCAQHFLTSSHQPTAG